MEKLNININKDESNANDFLVLFELFGQRPNKTVIHDTFSGVAFDKILSSFITDKSNIREKFDNTLNEYIPLEDDYTVNQKIFKLITDNVFCSYVVINRQAEDYIVNDVFFYYKEKDEIIDNIIKEISECVVEYNDSKIDKFNTITITGNALDIEPMFIDEESLDIELKYKKETIKSVDKIIKKIKKSKKGLSIFYGDRGTGKTNMIKYVASELDRITVFIPNNMIELTINNPDFRNFLKKYQHLLLVIDDCEFLTNSQFSKITNFTNSITQLVDGFLSDSLNLHILLIFNDHIDDIDESIIDINNLIGEVEFDSLDKDTATELSESIGFKTKYKSDVRLVDVYKNSKNEKPERIGL